MRVQIADTGAHQPMPLDEFQHFVVVGDVSLWKIGHEPDEFLPAR